MELTKLTRLGPNKVFVKLLNGKAGVVTLGGRSIPPIKKLN